MWLIIIYHSQALFGGDLDGQRGAVGNSGSLFACRRRALFLLKGAALGGAVPPIPCNAKVFFGQFCLKFNEGKREERRKEGGKEGERERKKKRERSRFDRVCSLHLADRQTDEQKHLHSSPLSFAICCYCM